MHFTDLRLEFLLHERETTLENMRTEFLHGRQWYRFNRSFYGSQPATQHRRKKEPNRKQNMCEHHRNGTAKTRQDHQ